MATSLEQPDKECRIAHTINYIPFGESLVKIGPVDPKIIGLQGINDMAISLHRAESFNCPLVISGVTGLKFIKFLINVSGSSPLLMHSSALRKSNLLWNASAKKEGGVSQAYL